MTERPDAWLDSIRVASPCNESWEGMVGDDRSRHCARCELNVFNLTALTRAEAAALVAARGGTLCIRMARRADGTVLLRDCPTGLSRARRRLALVAAGAAGLLAAVVGLVAAAVHGRRTAPTGSTTAGWTERVPGPLRAILQPFDEEPPGRVIMGEMVMPTPPTPPATGGGA